MHGLVRGFGSLLSRSRPVIAGRTEGPEVNCWAVVAINTRLRRKGRLRGELNPAERDALSRRMLDHVLVAADDARSIAHVLIVSPDRQGLPPGYEVLHDAGSGLNAAFELARECGRAALAQEMVLLPADLPRLSAADIDALIAAGRRAGIAIAPDRRGTGTNGLYLPVALDFTCRFGVASRARHEAEARRQGIEPAIVMRPGLAADLDTPADLRMLGRRGMTGAANAACAGGSA
jgi:2-phospho-L-lactate guanylyltransferase